MKKIKYASILVAIMLLISGCSEMLISSGHSDEADSKVFDEHGNELIYSSDRLCKYSLANPPAEMDYQDMTIKLAKLNVYQLSADHSFVPYVIVSMDLRAMSEDELYWFIKEDFEGSCYITHAANEHDKRRLSYICSVDQGGYRNIVYALVTEQNRYEFSDFTLNVEFQIVQEDALSGKSENERMKYIYYFEQNYEDVPESLYSINQGMQDSINKGLERIASLYGSLLR